MKPRKPHTFFRPKLKRHPSRTTMTVCIAAACQESKDNDAPRIVVCCDWRGEIQQVGSADTTFKFRNISNQWVALQAGNVSRADELCNRYEEALKEKNFTDANVEVEARKVFNAYKKTLADSYMQSTFAIPFDDLINKGREKLGDTFVDTCLEQISRIEVKTQLIIAGISEVYDYIEKKMVPSPTICVIDECQDDPVAVETEFGVIGSGSNAAKTMLFYREQESTDTLMETIYAVYEAKLMSETVPGVGESLFLAVLYPDNTVREITEEGNNRCQELYARFGPRSRNIKNRDEWFSFKPDYLEPFGSKPSPTISRSV